jgi:hypothetical protein
MAVSARTATKDSMADIQLTPIPSLLQLRELVLARSRKRMPRWKFRLHTDLVISIQPKPTGRLFACIAVDADGAGIDDLTATYLPRNRHASRLIFNILEDWRFRLVQVNWPPDNRARQLDAVRRRVVEALPQLATLRPEMLLRPQCLRCGRQLSDPASMGRWFGPECLGTTSIEIPWLVPVA